MRLRASLISVLLLAASGCGGAGGPSVPNAPPGWVTHGDDSGFVIQVPKSWRVSASDGRVDVTGDSGEQLVVWPLLFPFTVSADAAANVMVTTASQVLPQMRWSDPSPAADDLVRMAGGDGSSEAVVALAWVNGGRGSAGVFYASAAPNAVYAAEAKKLARVLESFQVVGSSKPGAASGPKLSYVPIQDPNERAFTAEVPRGWRPDAGVTSIGFNVPKWHVQASSPDGSMSISMGNNFYEYVDFGQGGTGQSGPYLVAPYSPGSQYFTREILPQQHPDASIDDVRDRPDVAESFPVASNSRVDAGEVRYSYGASGVLVQGVALTITTVTGIGGVGNWLILGLYQAEARADRFPVAQAAPAHLAGSFVVDPAWAARTLQAAAQTSQIWAAANDRISQTISQGYESRSSVVDEVNQRYEKALLGVEQVVDQDGTQYEVYSGANYDWIDYQGHILGTDVEARPSVDFRELVRIAA